MLTFAPPSITAFTLPADAADAQASLLALVDGATTDLYVSCFTLTWVNLFTRLEAAAARRVRVHILADLSQALSFHGEVLAGLEALEAALPGGDLTLTTAGPDSPRPSAIHHQKTLWTPEGDCWEGSTNLTVDAWLEGNCASRFQSPEWADMMTADFLRVKAWALALNSKTGKSNVWQLGQPAPSKAELLGMVGAAESKGDK
jgi:hypothetical protein